MGKRKRIPFCLIINLFQHGDFKGEEGWSFKKAQSLPVDLEKIIKDEKYQSLKSGKGRKPGTGWTPKGRIIGRVHALIGAGKNKEQSFKQIAEERNCEYYTVRDIYYKSLRKEYRDEIIFMDGVTLQLVPWSGSEVDDPEYTMEKLIERYGKEEAKRIMLKQIGEAEKFLNKESSSDTEKVYKDILIKHGLIEKAKSLLAQMG